MKYVKILGLLAVAAAALMAFAASASATTLTSPTGTTYTGAIHADNEGTHVTLDNPIANIECHSTVSGNVEQHGPGVTVKGNITVTFTSCTEGWHVTVLNSGNLEVHKKAGTTYDGTLTSNNAEVSATVSGITCVYGTSATDVGTLTGGTTPTLDIEAKIPVLTGKSSIFCGTSATTWTGSYTVTTPGSLYVDE